MEGAQQPRGPELWGPGAGAEGQAGAEPLRVRPQRGGGGEGEDLASFSSCYKYQTPTSNLSQQESEYFSPKELFADIGIKYIDCEDTDGNNGRDDDTSISSFTSTYQTPSSGGSYENKLVRDLSREMRETADLSQELSKHVERASLNTSDVSSNISESC